MKQNNDKQKGFTIIEMMISVALFSIIMTMGIGALLNANSLHKKSQKLRAIIDNLNFVMEDISRNIRLGTDYSCGPMLTGPFPAQDCPPALPSLLGSYFLAFESSTGKPNDTADQWIYGISSNKRYIYKSVKGD